MTTTKTLRSGARELVAESVNEAASLSHERNYHKLHVWRDGTINWFECINTTDDVIDRRADGFAAVPSVITVGTGSYACNCDHCNDVYDRDAEALARERGWKYDKDAKYSTRADAIADAVTDSDLSDMEEAMLAELQRIPFGYFDDEHFQIAGEPHIKSESCDAWETVMSIDLKREDGTTGDVWIVAGVPDYQQGSALAAASGREDIAARAYPGMMTVRAADFGSWDAWCGFERPAEDDEAREMMDAIIATVEKVALRTHLERLQDSRRQLQIFIDRKDGRGPVLDGCWGSQHARFKASERGDAVKAMQDLAELYPDADWVLMDSDGDQLQRIEATVQEIEQ